MNTSRRNFFGLVGGAAVAGPSVAKQAVARLPQGLGLVGGMEMNQKSDHAKNGCTTEGVKALSDVDWRLDAIADLKRVIAGDLTDEEKEERRRRRLSLRQNVISQEVASLRSVSDVRKIEIYSDRICRLNEELERSEQQSRLWRYLKEVGQ